MKIIDSKSDIRGYSLLCVKMKAVVVACLIACAACAWPWPPTYNDNSWHLVSSELGVDVDGYVAAVADYDNRQGRTPCATAIFCSGGHHHTPHLFPGA